MFIELGRTIKWCARSEERTTLWLFLARDAAGTSISLETETTADTRDKFVYVKGKQSKQPCRSIQIQFFT
mgnify:CR=1 FL=1